MAINIHEGCYHLMKSLTSPPTYIRNSCIGNYKIGGFIDRISFLAQLEISDLESLPTCYPRKKGYHSIYTLVLCNTDVSRPWLITCAC